MTDEKVLDAQRWANATYGGVAGYNPCPETGKTGWATMYSLTRGLQHELGITALSDTFGPTTLAKLAELGDIGPTFTAKPNIVKILQHALYCKGYWAGVVTGDYHSSTETAVGELKMDAGLVNHNSRVQPKIFKAILTMDAYVLLSGGNQEIRQIQGYLNNKYIHKSTFFLAPTDGHYSRDVQTALLKAIQYELGIPESQVTGSFGPATRDGLRRQTVGPGSSGIWVELFSAACVFNGQLDREFTTHKSQWDDDLANYVRAFQDFSALYVNGRVTGVGDFQTWAQLLVSTGDPDRPAGACDTRYHISVARAKALKAAGYHVVGRYLDEDPDSKLNKELQPGELEAIFAGGLRVFPISQYNARRLVDFTYSQGYAHAVRAHDRAVGYGFNAGTIIYFAVDYDATGEEIKSNVLPYFHGVQKALGERGRRYIPGVYGSRNVCTQVSNYAKTPYSFVSGMSYGFSGNLGFPMPANWSFTQIKEFKFTAGADSFDLDRNVHRPHSDPGVGPENMHSKPTSVESFLAYVDELHKIAQAYANPTGRSVNLLVLEYLRHPNYTEVYKGWWALIGNPDWEWLRHVDANESLQRVSTYLDPFHGVEIHADHLAATASGVVIKDSGRPSGPLSTRGDFAGWGGDLTSFYGDWQAESNEYASGYAFCKAKLANNNVLSTFKLRDIIEDADGYHVGTAVRNGADIRTALREQLTGNGFKKRFTDFFNRRYGGSIDNTMVAAQHMLINGDDTPLVAMRDGLVWKSGGITAVLPHLLSNEKMIPFLRGYAEAVQRLASQE
ncbi:peptidoglycan hydrolase-like protein with peptidoglycan-binding domain [Crossiella equi]|uniref:Peptidoglycan hydrolase-like protein with peptidoglycan-binding domain n=1 Tax=Crossiella equi TaxID=130796 RepID=A0ABS5AGA4_9PSEU|nr:glycoside hydrolase domain-containing protein [Crossiella equi]MBP2475597.1 peptidoglycan hydrolase-like protein with peptidoglycan-binding domain [Crossiella equi]